MESPIGTIYVKERKNSNEFLVYLEHLVLGEVDDIEKWMSIVVSTNGKKVIGMID